MRNSHPPLSLTNPCFGAVPACSTAPAAGSAACSLNAPHAQDHCAQMSPVVELPANARVSPYARTGKREVMRTATRARDPRAECRQDCHCELRVQTSPVTPCEEWIVVDEAAVETDVAVEVVVQAGVLRRECYARDGDVLSQVQGMVLTGRGQHRRGREGMKNICVPVADGELPCKPIEFTTPMAQRMRRTSEASRMGCATWMCNLRPRIHDILDDCPGWWYLHHSTCGYAMSNREQNGFFQRTVRARYLIYSVWMCFGGGGYVRASKGFQAKAGLGSTSQADVHLDFEETVRTYKRTEHDKTVGGMVLVGLLLPTRKLPVVLVAYAEGVVDMLTI
ncbi:hypothetical protein B0H21DRAFT_710422 [Amylocystis lapponica]|nr:hypothetical protein B0H21DRAFT_710422 [Amylocystis lapponica]